MKVSDRVMRIDGIYDEDMYILDEAGEPACCPEYWRFMKFWTQPGTRQRCRIAFTRIDHEVYVSTVFLRYDHGFRMLHRLISTPEERVQYKPVLWETMIFGGNENGYQERYNSRAEAEAGHERAVRMALHS